MFVIKFNYVWRGSFDVDHPEVKRKQPVSPVLQKETKNTWNILFFISILVMTEYEIFRIFKIRIFKDTLPFSLKI